MRILTNNHTIGKLLELNSGEKCQFEENLYSFHFLETYHITRYVFEFALYKFKSYDNTEVIQIFTGSPGFLDFKIVMTDNDFTNRKFFKKLVYQIV